ncbi:hypothetical protein Nepgr_020027 [Nepenthes gracilis]|uniref:catalase n=1 Tax=Nepenthes gracilis TaxID=150966 RepID=A0AAD3SY95_NEPGR|nr:hypothetical protein Nepgr_020027 [Nepenthes gracilis]
MPCYTSEGTFDLMENNFPVSLIRSGIQFPDMDYPFTPKPESHMQDNWRIVDCYSYNIASLHMFPFSFDDVGVSQDYRHMEGFGVNAYTLINIAAGTEMTNYLAVNTTRSIVVVQSADGVICIAPTTHCRLPNSSSPPFAHSVPVPGFFVSSQPQSINTFSGISELRQCCDARTFPTVGA